MSGSAFRSPGRILCPTDFSPHSERALEYAVAIGRAASAELVLLHVCLLPIPNGSASGDVDWMPPDRSARGELLERMRRFAEPADAAGLETRILLHEGDPAREILRSATAVDADLIVMGCHARRGVERLVLGSHAEQVLRRARCPVLTVSGATPPEARPGLRRIDSVVCASSATPRSETTLEYARGFARCVGAGFSALHVDDPFLASPANAIARGAEERHADLVVVGAHDEASTSRGLVGSIATLIAHHAACAVLTVRSCATRDDAEARNVLAARR